MNCCRGMYTKLSCIKDEDYPALVLLISDGVLCRVHKIVTDTFFTDSVYETLVKAKEEMINDNRTLVDQYDKHSKYIVEEMESTNDDYKLIKKSFEDPRKEVEAHKIYRVKQRISDGTDEKKSDNMLLFHGTSVDAAVGILEKGYKPSKGGSFGPGVYLTSSPGTSVGYSVSKTSLRGYYHGIISDSKQSSYSV